MATVGGSIRQISIRGRIFAVPSDVDAQRKLGGDENEVQTNGDRTSRIIKTIVAWALSSLTVSVDDSRGDQEFLQDVANSSKFSVITVTFASGITWEGEGIITEELNYSSQSATAAIALMGQGILNSQS